MSCCPKCRKRYAEGTSVCEADGSDLISDNGAVDQDLQEGQIVGEYRIDAKIGVGAYGEVYRAHHPVIGKVAAIKVLHSWCSSEPLEVERFVAEARAVNKIRHRHIVDIFSFGQLDDGRHYYVMEYLEGTTLQEYLRKRIRLTVAETIRILRPVARALDAAHGRGIAHRDLKPDNIFLTEDDGLPFPKLLDFGIAKLLEAESPSEMALGTPLYMSPEQCRGEEIGPRTDTYSFGVVAYEMLTGRVPFSGRSVMEVFSAHVSRSPLPLSQVCPDLPVELDSPILAMLEKNPLDRPVCLVEAMEAFAERAHELGLWESLSNPSMVSGILQPDTYEPVIPSSRNTKPPTPRRPPSPVETRRAPNTTARTVLPAAVILSILAVAIGMYMQRQAMSGPLQPFAGTAVVQSSSASPLAPSSSPSQLSPIHPDDDSDEIELSINSVPSPVDVYIGVNRVGMSPGPIKLKRSPAKIHLVFKARGYATGEMEIDTKTDSAISVHLQRFRKPRSPKSRDLENPF
jgi:serine/threonine-protein kinase